MAEENQGNGNEKTGGPETTRLPTAVELALEKTKNYVDKGNKTSGTILPTAVELALKGDGEDKKSILPTAASEVEETSRSPEAAAKAAQVKVATEALKRAEQELIRQEEEDRRKAQEDRDKATDLHTANIFTAAAIGLKDGVSGDTQASDSSSTAQSAPTPTGRPDDSAISKGINPTIKGIGIGMVKSYLLTAAVASLFGPGGVLILTGVYAFKSAKTLVNTFKEKSEENISTDPDNEQIQRSGLATVGAMLAEPKTYFAAAGLVMKVAAGVAGLGTGIEIGYDGDVDKFMDKPTGHAGDLLDTGAEAVGKMGNEIVDIVTNGGGAEIDYTPIPDSTPVVNAPTDADKIMAEGHTEIADEPVVADADPYEAVVDPVAGTDQDSYTGLTRDEIIANFKAEQNGEPIPFPIDEASGAAEIVDEPVVEAADVPPPSPEAEAIMAEGHTPEEINTEQYAHLTDLQQVSQIEMAAEILGVDSLTWDNSIFEESNDTDFDKAQKFAEREVIAEMLTEITGEPVDVSEITPENLDKHHAIIMEESHEVTTTIQENLGMDLKETEYGHMGPQTQAAIRADLIEKGIDAKDMDLGALMDHIKSARPELLEPNLDIPAAVDADISGKTAVEPAAVVDSVDLTKLHIEAVNGTLVLTGDLGTMTPEYFKTLSETIKSGEYGDKITFNGVEQDADGFLQSFQHIADPQHVVPAAPIEPSYASPSTPPDEQGFFESKERAAMIEQQLAAIANGEEWKPQSIYAQILYNNDLEAAAATNVITEAATALNASGVTADAASPPTGGGVTPNTTAAVEPCEGGHTH